MADEVPSCIILGAGGHARVLIDALQSAGTTNSLGILDAGTGFAGTTIFGVPVLGDDGLLPTLARNGTRRFVVAVGSIGDWSARRRLFDQAVALGLSPLTVIHPRSVISPWAEIGPGSQILACAVVNAGARLGKNVIVNTGAIVEHDCTLGDYVHVATGARLASTISIGEGAHVGAGAVIRQCIEIGSNAVIGAGAVVVSNVPPSTTVVGVPAAPLRRAAERTRL